MTTIVTLVSKVGRALVSARAWLALLRHRRRWLIAGLLFFVSTISYLDRQTLSVLAGTLRGELGLSSERYGAVVTAFLVAYGVGFCFSGRLIDRFGVKLCFGTALAVWTAAAMLHAVVSGWRGLIVLRFVLGLGESFATPTAAKVLSAWIPSRERGLCTAVYSTGHFAGAMIAPPLVAWLALSYRWSYSFLATGASGLVLLGLWFWFYRPPESHPMLSGEERRLILRERTTVAVDFGRVSTWSLLRHPVSFGFFCTRFFTDAFSYFFVFWIPVYLQTSRGYTLAMIGLLAWIPYLGADFGTIGGGAWSDILVRRGLPLRQARMRVMLVSAFLTPLALAAVLVPSASIALVLIAVIMAAQACWNTNLFTLTQESAPPGCVASVAAVSILGGTVGGSIANLVTGHIIREVGYVPVFAVLGFVHLGGYLIVRQALIRGDRLKSKIENEG